MQIELMRRGDTDPEKPFYTEWIEKHYLIIGESKREKKYRLSPDWFERFLPLMRQIHFEIFLGGAFLLGTSLRVELFKPKKGRKEKVESLYYEFLEFRKERSKKTLEVILICVGIGLVLLVTL